MRKGKRTIAKAKTYGFNPWADQIDSINAIITKTGAKEATIIRKLVDEALVTRRLREAEVEIEQTTGAKGIAEALTDLADEVGQAGRHIFANAGCQSSSLTGNPGRGSRRPTSCMAERGPGYEGRRIEFTGT